MWGEDRTVFDQPDTHDDDFFPIPALSLTKIFSFDTHKHVMGIAILKTIYRRGLSRFEKYSARRFTFETVTLRHHFESPVWKSTCLRLPDATLVCEFMCLRFSDVTHFSEIVLLRLPIVALGEQIVSLHFTNETRGKKIISH
jgi:hypothetical protein